MRAVSCWGVRWGVSCAHQSPLHRPLVQVGAVFARGTDEALTHEAFPHATDSGGWWADELRLATSRSSAGYACDAPRAWMLPWSCSRERFWHVQEPQCMLLRAAASSTHTAGTGLQSAYTEELLILPLSAIYPGGGSLCTMRSCSS